jgi:hypothetical protein
LTKEDCFAKLVKMLSPKNMSALRIRNPVHDTWITPKDFYDKLDNIFNFDDFDPCPPFNDIEEFNGLLVPWADRVFCNPPYSQKLKEAFIYKAYQESLLGKFTVNLVPVSTSTKIFHELILTKAKVEFVRGRLPFEGLDNDGNWCNPGKGMYNIDEWIPEYAPTVNRSGQQDLMLVIFGQPF